MRYRTLLAAIFQYDRIRRIPERKYILQRLQIEGGGHLHPGLSNERLGELGHGGRDPDQSHITLPMQLRHPPSRRIAVAAIGVVEEQENPPVLERIRLSIHSDRIRSFRPALFRDRGSV